MQACHSQVGEQLDFLPHQTGGQLRLLCHWQVGCPGGHNQRSRLHRFLRVRTHYDSSGEFVVLRVRRDIQHRAICVPVGLGDQDRVAPTLQRRNDSGDLFRRLAPSQHDLRGASAQRAMVVDARISQVLERQVAQFG